MSNEVLVEPLLIFFCLLFIATLCATLFRHLKFPYTIGLLIVGMLIGFISHLLPSLDLFSYVTLSPELILYIILPTLIFEASINIDARLLLDNIRPIMLLAVIGVVISCILIGGSLAMLGILPLGAALIFGAMISATDPVAVIALFKELKANERLSLLMDGESLLNDATAIVLFSVLTSLGSSVSDMGGSDLLMALAKFALTFFGGVLFGGAVGIVMVALLRLARHDRFVQRSQMIILAYVTFIVADHYLHLSGVMAVLSAGIIVSLNRHRVVDSWRWDNIHVFWEYAAFVANSFIFLMMGMTESQLFSNPTQFLKKLPVLLLATGIVIAARAVIIYGLVPMNNFLKWSAPISKGMQTVMFWGGLRGAVPIALMMAMPEDIPGRELIVDMVLTIILATLLIQGTTTGRLLEYFKLSGLKKSCAMKKDGVAQAH